VIPSHDTNQVWFDSYTRKDGTFVQGHFGSPYTTTVNPAPVLTISGSQYEQDTDWTFWLYGFERGFIGDYPFVRLISGYRPTEPRLEYYCVKTPNGLIEGIDYVFFVNKEETRYSLKDANVWVGDGAELKPIKGVTPTDVIRYSSIQKIARGMVETIYKTDLLPISGEINGVDFEFPSGASDKIVTNFIVGCNNLR
jgi:hypothetical protein